MSAEWMLRAACAKADPDIFFPGRGVNANAAKEVCRRCDVVEECLAFAKDLGIADGIWGGLSERERRKVRPLQSCHVCGTRFRPNHGLEQACSDGCKAANRAARSRRKRAAA
jgi:predicted nucleic acid-binding Zn ribbon protein